jgi:two-component system chemotaxis sensor kinase CheA
MEPSQPAIALNDLGSEMAEVIKEFLVESNEGLDRFDRDLIALEKDRNSHELLDSIFRAIHTIKGTGGVLGYEKLVSISHLGETVLSRMRDGVVVLSAEIATALLSMADALRNILENIATSGGEGTEDYSQVLRQLTAITQTQTRAVASVPAELSETAPRLGEILVDSRTCNPEDVQAAVRQQEQGDGRLLGEILVDERAVDPVAIAEGLKVQTDHREAASNTIRVDVALLDKVMNLVGELVLARNQVLQFTDRQEDSAFLRTAQRLNLITTELQEGVMKTRMQPIGNVWNKFPRVVRDLALACGKQVRLDMEGSGTELDRTIIEAIKDPLTHLLRNSVDHGIEPPAARLAAGKPVSGYLRLRAFHESGQVNIEISDDGAGIDLERITHRAVERGLISRDQVARMGDSELTQLIFLPGFSTADRVTNVSGRGVGMDVVKTNIEKIGGAIDVQSRRGSGMTVKIKIPLTLAIIPALIVSADGDHFAIPQVNLLELVHVEPDQAKRGIETIHGAPIFRLRGSLLPLVDLGRQLSLGGVDLVRPNEAINIVVLQADGRRFGLVVEGINDTEEIVVKPLGKQLKGVSLFAGATIMGDGRICLILDVAGIAHGAGVVSQMDDRRASGDATDGQERKNERSAFLLLRHGSDGRIAIPLSLVARLEEIPRSAIEHSADREVVQYRNQIIPLLPLSATLRHGQYHACQERDPMQVVVYSQNGRSVGLIVDEILDIVEDTIQVRSHRAGQGLIGSAVIQQRVTDVLDVSGLIQTFDPDLVGVSS